MLEGPGRGESQDRFADIRWMEVSSYLKRETAAGRKPIKHIIFTAERLDMTTIRRWRDRALGQGLP